MIEDIQIDEEQPDVTDIMLQIRAYIVERKLADSTSTRPLESRINRFSTSVSDHLLQALDASSQAHVQIDARPVRIPIIGALLSRSRELVHRLVIYYLDQLSARQIRFNVHSSKALYLLAHELDSEPDPTTLAPQIAELSKRVANLEALLAQLQEISPDTSPEQGS